MAKKSITVRIEERDADELAEMARAKRQRTGEPASVSDIVREAVRAHLDNQEEDMTHKSLDDAVSQFWSKHGAPEGGEFDAFVARQPSEVVAEWRAFLGAELKHWEFEYKTGYQNERALLKDGYEAQSERAGIAAAEAHRNADECREMLEAVSRP